jgi:hypothetical protein
VVIFKEGKMLLTHFAFLSQSNIAKFLEKHIRLLKTFLKNYEKLKNILGLIY